MNNFMQEAVDEICKSMRDDPDRWVLKTNTIKDKFSGVEYWSGVVSEIHGITHVWSGVTTEQVFTTEQGKQILFALNQMKKHKASVQQQRVLKAMVSAPVITYPKSINGVSKKWWEFWK